MNITIIATKLANSEDIPIGQIREFLKYYTHFVLEHKLYKLSANLEDETLQVSAMLFLKVAAELQK